MFCLENASWPARLRPAVSSRDACTREEGEKNSLAANGGLDVDGTQATGREVQGKGGRRGVAPL